MKREEIVPPIISNLTSNQAFEQEEGIILLNQLAELSRLKKEYEKEVNSGATDLHIAIRHNMQPLAQYLVKTCPDDVNAFCCHGATPILLSIKHGSSEMTKFLVDNGANIHELHKNGTSVLHFASAYNPYLVRYFVEHGVNIDTTAQGSSALCTAYKRNHLEVVQYLISKGIDINAIPSSLLTEMYRDPYMERLLQVARFSDEICNETMTSTNRIEIEDDLHGMFLSRLHNKLIKDGLKTDYIHFLASISTHKYIAPELKYKTMLLAKEIQETSTMLGTHLISIIENISLTSLPLLLKRTKIGQDLTIVEKRTLEFYSQLYNIDILLLDKDQNGYIAAHKIKDLEQQNQHLVSNYLAKLDSSLSLNLILDNQLKQAMADLLLRCVLPREIKEKLTSFYNEAKLNEANPIINMLCNSYLESQQENFELQKKYNEVVTQFKELTRRIDDNEYESEIMGDHP